MDILIRKRIIKALLLIAAVFAVGTTGFYVLLDRLTFIDAFYLTVVTLTTVGYGDLTPRTNMPEGGNPYIVEGFAILIILFGMSSLFYVVEVITESIVTTDMLAKRRRKRIQKLISTLREHYILLGAGRAGVYMMDEMEKTCRPFVVIERSEKRINEILPKFDDLLYIVGDATQDERIVEAGLEHAAGVICALPDEKDNLFIVMSLSQKKREMGGRFRIVARVEQFRKMAPKLKSAGADAVISPERISSHRMVSEMFRPSVTTFLDRMLKDDRGVTRIEEVIVDPESDLCGVTLKTSRILEKTGLLIVAFKKGTGGPFLLNPGPLQEIGPGDVLITMGPMERILALRGMAQPN